MGYTGLGLRVAGLNYDLRKVSPYYFYDAVDFEVPLGVQGTGYDCYLVKVEEVRQSLSIISQVLGNLPEGKATGRGEFPGEGQGPAGEVYSFVEGPLGEMGLFLTGRGGPKPYRLKVRSPHYPILFSLDELFRGKTLEEADDMLYTFHLDAREIDR